MAVVVKADADLYRGVIIVVFSSVFDSFTKGWYLECVSSWVVEECSSGVFERVVGFFVDRCGRVSLWLYGVDDDERAVCLGFVEGEHRRVMVFFDVDDSFGLPLRGGLEDVVEGAVGEDEEVDDVSAEPVDVAFGAIDVVGFHELFEESDAETCLVVGVVVEVIDVQWADIDDCLSLAWVVDVEDWDEFVVVVAVVYEVVPTGLYSFDVEVGAFERGFEVVADGVAAAGHRVFDEDVDVVVVSTMGFLGDATTELQVRVRVWFDSFEEFVCFVRVRWGQIVNYRW